MFFKIFTNKCPKKLHRMSICESLLIRNKINAFFKRMFTGDETWIPYDNVKWNGSWSNSIEPPQTVTKPELMGRMVLLSIWWNW